LLKKLKRFKAHPETMVKNKFIALTAGIIISLVLLASSFININFYSLVDSLKSVEARVLLLSIFFIFLSYCARTLMWRITTKPTKIIPFSTLFGGIAVGYMVNGILPFRAGEFFRAQFLSSATGLGRTVALSTIFIERILDMITLGFLVLMGLFWGIQGLTLQTVKIVLLICLLVALTAGFLIRYSDKLEKAKQKLAFISPKLPELFAHFLLPFRELHEVKKIVFLFMLSIVSWIGIYFSLLTLVYSSVPISPYQAALLLFLFVNIGMLIPAAPGALGVLQMAFWLSLSQFGVIKEQAIALSFVYLFLSFFFNIGIGLPYFVKAHLWSQRKGIQDIRRFE